MDYESCFDAFEYADKIVVLTGAGVSTLSGIADFRGANGIYTRHQVWNGYKVENLLDTDFFKAHPDVFYRYAKECLYPMTFKEPSLAHKTLAAMEKRRLVNVLYTQNIDLLHTKAGSRKVEELHGSFCGHHCIKCGMEFGLEAIREQVMHSELPVCPVCGGIVKPNIILYGDEMNMEQLDRAFRDFETADILLIMGSSLSVPPVSSLPMATKFNRGRIIIVNEQATPYDPYAAWHFTSIAEFCLRIREYYRLEKNNHDNQNLNISDGNRIEY